MLKPVLQVEVVAIDSTTLGLLMSRPCPGMGMFLGGEGGQKVSLV
jgi:hypothetical protein